MRENNEQHDQDCQRQHASGLPPAQGLYDPANEHDACGLGFVASIRGEKSHSIVEKGIEVLTHLEHRGACGCDPETGDGAGVLIQIPHEFFVRECAVLGMVLPEPGCYAVGMVFLPVGKPERLQCEGVVEKIIQEEGFEVMGWRDTPIDPTAIGRIARGSQPYIEQIFLKALQPLEETDFERKLYVVRRRIENEIAHSDDIEGKSHFYIPSLSCRTIVYKGLLLAPQITKFYPELSDPLVKSALCMVHQRFSTNTFPSWPLAHPFHHVAHNGEINTIKGNIIWMNARQRLLESSLFGNDLKKILPVITPGGSDSASLDNAVELLLHAGRELPHVLAMLIPEAWSRNPHMDPAKRAFYEYHASLMEPWDGPASLIFTDGRVIGATLDRNGLRPGRYIVTTDDLVVLSSEVGVLEFSPERVKYKGRLQPGRMFLVDTVAGRIVSDDEIKSHLAARQPYAEWIKENQITLEHLPEPTHLHAPSHESIIARQRVFGYTEEDIKIILEPMARNGEEPVGSMGSDTPLACLSDQPQLLFNYFKQLFAQVTNPPIDPIREDLLMSLISYIGTERNILVETPLNCHTLKLTHPVVTNRDLEKLRRVSSGDLLAATSIGFLPRRRRGSGTQARTRRPLPPRLARRQQRLHSADYLRPWRR